MRNALTTGRAMERGWAQRPEEGLGLFGGKSPPRKYQREMGKIWVNLRKNANLGSG